MATADKLNKLLETKAAIRNAIVNKGVEVGEDVVFADYPTKIAAIEGGNSSPDYIALRTSNHTNYNSLFAFYKGESLDAFELNTWDTNNVTTMESLFSYCESLTSLNINKWNTSNVTSMNSIFAYCKKLTKLDINNFNTSNATDISRMFNQCHSLESLELSNFNTSNVKYMGYMFYYCESLISLNLSNFDMTNVTSTTNMFYNCKKLHTLRLDNCYNDTINKIITSTGFPTGLVDGEIRKMWVSPKYVADLTAPDGWEFIDCFTDEVIDPKEEIPLYQPDMFRYNGDIEEVSVMVTSEHDNLEYMFQNCENLRIINGINEWDTSNVTNMSNMFYNCRSLESLDLSSFKTSNVDNMWDMFSDCENLKELNLSSFEIKENCCPNYMLNNCRKLHTLRLDNCNEDTIRKIIESDSFPTGEAEDNWGETRKIYCLEKNVANLTAPDGWVFVDWETGEEIAPEEIPLYQVGQFQRDTTLTEVRTMVNESHPDLGSMFDSCTNLVSVNTNDWNVVAVTNMDYMFYNCTSLTELNLSDWILNAAVTTYNMFAGCTSLHTIRLDNCSNGTIYKLLGSNTKLPTDDIGITRTIYVKESAVTGSGFIINKPENWNFVYVD